MTLPPIEHTRHARAGNTYCPKNRCTGNMQAQCSPNQECRRLGKELPSCWFAMGTTSYTTDWDRRHEGGTPNVNYYHHTNADVACLPCCQTRSNHKEMPSKSIMIIEHIMTEYLSLCSNTECWCSL